MEQIAWDLVHFLRRELVSRGKEKRERGMGYGAETVSHSLFNQSHTGRQQCRARGALPAALHLRRWGSH